MIDRIYVAAKFVNEDKALEIVKKFNLSYEIPVFMAPEVLDDWKGEAQACKEKYKDIPGFLSLHGPIFDTNPVSLDPKLAKISHDRYVQAINAAKLLGAKHIVFHTQFSPVYRVANIYKDWIGQNADYWAKLIEEHVEGSDLVLLIENFMDDMPEVLNDLVSRVNSLHFKACLDTGHVNLFSEVPAIDWVDELGSNLVYVHAHNNHGEFDEHSAFTNGTIDMEGFMNHLVLLPNHYGLALEIFDLKGVVESYDFLKPFMQIQNEQAMAKNFLL